VYNDSDDASSFYSVPRRFFAESMKEMKDFSYWLFADSLYNAYQGLRVQGQTGNFFERASDRINHDRVFQAFT
jgi:hypothetical protein